MPFGVGSSSPCQRSKRWWYLFDPDRVWIYRAIEPLEVVIPMQERRTYLFLAPGLGQPIQQRPNTRLCGWNVLLDRL